MERSKGTITNQENSGTVGDGNAVLERVGYGEEEISVEVEPSVKATVWVLLHSLELPVKL